MVVEQMGSNVEDLPALEPQSEEFAPESEEFATEALVDEPDINQVLQAYQQELLTLRTRVSQLLYTQQSFENDDVKCKYYTSFSFQRLKLLFEILEPKMPAHHLRKLTKFQQLLVTLMKLRLDLDFTDLAYRFQVSRKAISHTFFRTVFVMYCRLKFLVKWPNREDLIKTMPQSFKDNFGNKITLIIDAFEVRCQRPTFKAAAAQHYSNYKGYETVKFLIGVSPQGSIMYISKGYGGRSSDKFITTDCGILENLKPGDYIMADRGFTIADNVEANFATLVQPSFIPRNEKRLSPVSIEESRRISNVRIHVERIIGTMKQKFTILRHSVPIYYFRRSLRNQPIIDVLVAVTSALINFSPSVVPLY